MELAQVAAMADVVVRAIALAAAGFAGAVALTHWGVRTRKLQPFGGLSRTMRSLSDPALRPIEKGLVKRGRNPQDATLWLLGITVVAGLVLVTGTRWIFQVIYSLSRLETASPGVWAQLVLGWAFSLVMGAIFVRVIASWLRISTYSKWMRPVMWLTDWIVNPIRRMIPSVGGIIDVSPVIAYFALLLLRSFLFAILF